jgi:hypothetical protein
MEISYEKSLRRGIKYNQSRKPSKKDKGTI